MPDITKKPSYSDKLKKIRDNADELKKTYGEKEYNRALNYYTLKSASQRMGSLVDTSKVDKLYKEKDYAIKTFGKKQYEEAYKDYYNKAVTEYNTVEDTYQNIGNKYTYSDLANKYPDIAKNLTYSDTYEDKVRRAYGLTPSSFDLQKYAPDPMQTIANDLSPEQIEDLLRNYTNKQKIFATKDALKKSKGVKDITQRVAEVQEKPSTAISDIYYVTYGIKPTAEDIYKKVDELGLSSTGLNKKELSGDDKTFADIYNAQIGDVLSKLSEREKNSYKEDIARYITYINIGADSDIQSYIDIYEDVYGKKPSTDDMIALSNRLKGKVQYESTGYDDPNAFGGGGGGGGGKPDQKDNEFFDKALRVAVSSDLRNYTGNVVTGENSSALAQVPVGALARGANQSNVGFENAGLTVASALGGAFIDNDAPKRLKNYLNEKSRMLNEGFAQKLQSTPDYSPWLSTAQNIGAGVITTGIDIALGQLAGKAAQALKGTSMLTNPAIKPSIINRIAPNAGLKTMFVRQFGDNITKYEELTDNNPIAPVMAMADATVSTYIEGLSGIFSPDSAFIKGISKAPQNFFVAWGKDLLGETGEEILQSGASSVLESISTGRPLSESPSMLTPEGLAETGISVALTTLIFGLSELGSNKTSQIMDAYEQGNFKKATEIGLEAIEEVKTKATPEDAQIFEQIQNELQQETPQDIQPQQATQPEQAPVSPVAETTQVNNINTPVPQENAVNEPASGGKDTRKTAISMSEKYAGTDYGEILSAYIEAGKYDYTPESSAKKYEAALNNVDNGNITYDDYTTIYDKRNNSIKSYTAQDIANLVVLIDKADTEGNTEVRDSLTASLVEAGTELGRAVQAYSLIKKSNSSVYLAAVLREIEKFNAKGQKRSKKWNNISLTEQEKNAILNSKTFEERESIKEEAYTRINNELPKTMWQKFDQLRKNAMLFNLKTQLRNIGGNTAYEAVNAIARKVEAIIQKLLPKEKRTQVFFIKPEYRNMVKNEFNKIKTVYQNQGRYNIEAQLGKGYMQAFKNKGIGKLINTMSRAVGWALDIGDVIFGKHHYETALASYLQAKGLKEITGEARAHALNLALEATFREESQLADWINKLIKKGGIGGKAVSFVVPFVKTPINIAKEAADFSPLGLGKSILVDTYKLAKGKIDASTYIHNLAKGLTGSAVTALGYVLSSGALGFVKLTGAPPEDKEEREFLQSQGWQPYSLQIGNFYIPISWMQPIATALLMGTSLNDVIDKKDADFNDVLGIADVMVNSIIEVSPLQGVKDILTYNESASDAAITVLTDLGTQFIPAVSKQLAQVIDPKRYVYGGGFEKLKSITAKGIPFIDNLLSAVGVDTDVAQRVDSWGEPQEQQGGVLGRIGNNMLSPSYGSSMPSDEINDVIQGLYESTKDNGVFPKIFADKKLSNKEEQAKKEEVGQAERRLIESYINSEEYGNDTDKQKVERIKDFYSDVVDLIKQGKGDLLKGDYGVKSKYTDDLFNLYEKTGDETYLLAKDTFTSGGKEYEYGDIVEEMFKGYGEVKGLEDVMSTNLFKSKPKEQPTIIKDTIEAIYSARKEDVLSDKSANIYAKETDDYNKFNAPVWSSLYKTENGKIKDEVVNAMATYKIYPHISPTFTSGGDKYNMDLTALANVTYEALKQYELSEDIMKTVVSKVYEYSKKVIAEGYALKDSKTQTDILNDLTDYFNRYYFK